MQRGAAGPTRRAVAQQVRRLDELLSELKRRDISPLRVLQRELQRAKLAEKRGEK